MGGLLAIPGFGEDKQEEAKKIIEDSVKTFTIQYTKSYGIQLFLALKKQARDKAQGGEEWQLMQRPEGDDEGCLLEGYLQKLTTGKKLVRRYFVVTSNYQWKYWETEEAYKKGGKAKRVIMPCGYNAVENVLEKLKKDALKLGQDLGLPADGVPVPTLPDMGVFGLYHNRRRTYVLQAENDDDKKKWLNIAKLSVDDCEGFANTDAVHKEAYDIAIRKTRESLNMSTEDWDYNGTETQVFSEMLVDALDEAVLGGVWNALKEGGAPPAIRIKARDKMLGVADASIGAAVGPAMTAMQTAVEKLREKVEEVVKSKMDVIAKVEVKVEDKIKSLTESLMSPIVDGKLKPQIGKVVAFIQTPVTNAFGQLVQIYDKRLEVLAVAIIKEAQGKPVSPEKWQSALKELELSTKRPWELESVYKELDSFTSGLKGLGEICADVDVGEIHDQAKESLMKVLSNAYYTFEKTVLEAAKGAKDASGVKTAIARSHGHVKQKLLADCKKATQILYQDVLNCIVMAYFNKLVDPACEPLLDQVKSLIPEDLSELLGISAMYNNFKGTIVSGVVESVIPAE